MSAAEVRVGTAPAHGARADAVKKTGYRPRQFEMLGVRIDNVLLDEAIEHVISRCEDTTSAPCQMAFVNAHCLNVAVDDSEYAAILRRAPRVYADGIGVKLGARAHGIEIVDNVNGTDMFPRLAAALENTEVGLYLLGAKPGIVDGVVSWLAQNYPRVKVKGAHHGYFSDDETDAIVERIKASGAQLLLVAMGVPRQEKWIETHLARCGVRVAIGVGALFDFYSQTIPRAPEWMRQNGLEWVYRLYQEPGRMWRRYVVGNPQFLLRVAQRRLRLPRFARIS